jgi:hypothetical protein
MDNVEIDVFSSSSVAYVFDAAGMCLLSHFLIVVVTVGDSQADTGSKMVSSLLFFFPLQNKEIGQKLATAACSLPVFMLHICGMESLERL